MLKGKHDVQISVGGESELHKHVRNCKKNPGHPKFIPIKSFNLKHLPEGHRDSDLYELIKATADLTVRLSVTMTSPDRPEFWPNTQIPYFLSELRGKEMFRTGTGMISGVRKYKDESYHRSSLDTPCPWDKCETSHQPSNAWWKIYVLTAAHVVFDNPEASHTTLRLFYDSEDSPLVILKDKSRVHYANIEEDWCMFTCLTCDENLGIKLEKIVKHFKYVRGQVRKKYRESRDDVKLNFIVSHPHGCSKQVSVGQWKDKVQMWNRKYDHKFTYTTCTCPGSSGATVYCVGYEGFYTGPVHCGSLRSGLNYSGVDLVG